MYRAQMLEFSIVNQLLALGMTGGTYNTYEETEAAVVGLLGATFGELNQKLADSKSDLTHLEDDLRRALRLRNFSHTITSASDYLQPSCLLAVNGCSRSWPRQPHSCKK